MTTPAYDDERWQVKQDGNKVSLLTARDRGILPDLFEPEDARWLGQALIAIADYLEPELSCIGLRQHTVGVRAARHLDALLKGETVVPYELPIDFARNTYPEWDTMSEAELRAALVNELDDIRKLVSNLTQVYCAVTCGMISKPLTAPEVVLSYYEDDVNRLCEQAVRDYQEENRT